MGIALRAFSILANAHLNFAPPGLSSQHLQKKKKNHPKTTKPKKVETILYANFRQYPICKQVFLSCRIFITLSASIWKTLFHFILSLPLLLFFFGYQYLSCH